MQITFEIPDDVAAALNAGSLHGVVLCNCASTAPTYPTCRSDEHLPGCVMHDLERERKLSMARFREADAWEARYLRCNEERLRLIAQNDQAQRRRDEGLEMQPKREPAVR